MKLTTVAICLIICLLTLTSCTNTQATKNHYRKEMNTQYPANSTRESIIAKHNKPYKSVIIKDGKIEDRIAKHTHEKLIEEFSIKAEQYDIFWIPRGSLGVGVYMDYVFYNKQMQVIRAYRIFID